MSKKYIYILYSNITLSLMVKNYKTNDTQQLGNGNISQEKHPLIKVVSWPNSFKEMHLYREDFQTKNCDQMTQ